MPDEKSPDSTGATLRPMRSRLPVVAVLAAGIAAALLLTAGSAPAARSCGSLRVRTGTNTTAHYAIKVSKGSVTCSTAHRVLSRFIRTNRRSRGWDCRNGHGTSWSEACGSPYHSLFDTFRDGDFRKVVKAYYRGTTGDESP
jgi:hypothetical protein